MWWGTRPANPKYDTLAYRILLSCGSLTKQLKQKSTFIFTPPFSLKTGKKSSMWELPPPETWEKKCPYVQRHRDSKRNVKNMPCYISTSLLHLFNTLLVGRGATLYFNKRQMKRHLSVLARSSVYFTEDNTFYWEAFQVKNLPAKVGDMGSIPGLRRSPGKREWQPIAVFLPGEPHGQRTLVGYSP